MSIIQIRSSRLFSLVTILKIQEKSFVAHTDKFSTGRRRYLGHLVTRCAFMLYQPSVVLPRGETFWFIVQDVIRVGDWAFGWAMHFQNLISFLLFLDLIKELPLYFIRSWYLNTKGLFHFPSSFYCNCFLFGVLLNCF